MAEKWWQIPSTTDLVRYRTELLGADVAQIKTEVQGQVVVGARGRLHVRWPNYDQEINPALLADTAFSKNDKPLNIPGRARGGEEDSATDGALPQMPTLTHVRSDGSIVVTPLPTGAAAPAASPAATSLEDRREGLVALVQTKVAQRDGRELPRAERSDAGLSAEQRHRRAELRRLTDQLAKAR